jgi:1-acyl-sn-glycerol-3-phosphate acyltransferase
MSALLRNGLFVLVYIVLLIVAVPVLLVCVLFGLPNTFLAYGTWMMRVGCAILGIRLETAGLQKLDPKTPYVFMSNHVSFLDGPLLVTVLDRPVRVIVKRFVFRIPVLGLGMRFAGYIPVDKEGAGSGKDRIAQAVRAVKYKGYSFLIFPEGTRSWEGTLRPFRRGGFFLALESGSPIVPVSIRGTHELMPRGRRFIRKGRVRITFHAPVPMAGQTEDCLAGLMDRVRETIASGLLP